MHPLIESFRAGHALVTCEVAQTDVEQQRLRLDAKRPASALSEGVRALFLGKDGVCDTASSVAEPVTASASACESARQLSSGDEAGGVMDRDGRLNLELIEGEWDDAALMEEVPCESAFSRASATLRSFLARVECAVGSALRSGDDALCALLNSAQWTGQGEVVRQMAPLCASSEPMDRMAAFLVLTAVFERALGNLFATLAPSKPPPSLLKNLLLAPELRAALGVRTMAALRVFCGPPAGINARNIAWHGFLSPDELPSRYSAGALAFVCHVGSVGVGSVVERPLRDYSVGRRFALPSEIDRYGMDLIRAHHVTVRSLIDECAFVVPGQEPLWHAAFALLQSQGEEMDMADDLHLIRVVSPAFLSLCLLLPCVEHSLRRLYAVANACEERVVTAESNTQYITLEHVTAPTTDVTGAGGGSPNFLWERLGYSTTEWAMDFFAYPEGLRLRDRLSHGEIDPSRMSPDTVAGAALFALSLCASEYYGSQRTAPLVVLLRRMSSTYRSRFHPFYRLVSELDDASSTVVGAVRQPMSRFSASGTSSSTGLVDAMTASVSATSASLQPARMNACAVLLEEWLQCESQRRRELEASHATDAPVECPCMRVCVPSGQLRPSDESWLPRRLRPSPLFIGRAGLERVALMRQIVEEVRGATAKLISLYCERREMADARKLSSGGRANFAVLELLYDPLLSALGCALTTAAHVTESVRDNLAASEREASAGRSAVAAGLGAHTGDATLAANTGKPVTDLSADVLDRVSVGEGSGGDGSVGTTATSKSLAIGRRRTRANKDFHKCLQCAQNIHRRIASAQWEDGLRACVEFAGASRTLCV